MSQGKLGVVTVTYNSSKFLDEFVASCNRQKLREFRVYSIDNNSPDDTADHLLRISDARWYVSINSDNRGVAAANNQGIVQALRDGCDWILLLNNDTSFDENFFSTLLSECVTNSGVVAVPKIYFDEPKGQIWYGGGGFRPLKGYTGYHSAMGEMDVGQCDQHRTVEYAPTCAMILHRSVFEDIGLMDETYFIYFDDTDFCWRLKRAGIQIAYTPATTLIHKVGGSTGGDRKPFTVSYTSRNRLYYLRKNFGAVSALAWRPFFLMVYLYRYLSGWWDYSCLTAALRGSFSYGRMRPSVPKLTKDLQKGRDWLCPGLTSGG